MSMMTNNNNPKNNEEWFWDGDFDRVLKHIEGAMGEWLVEKGVLHREDEKLLGVSDLLEGDIVYRIRRAVALEMDKDQREDFFKWSTVNPETGVETPRIF